jgi:5-methylcytosine-specific restriction endonuclease McrA
MGKRVAGMTPEELERHRARGRERHRERHAADPAYRSRHRERYAADPAYRERHLARDRERRADPSQRASRYASHANSIARKLGVEGKLTTAEVRAVWPELTGASCYLCGGTATSLDHVVPMARGGVNRPENLKPVCVPCNSRKRDKLPEKLVA